MTTQTQFSPRIATGRTLRNVLLGWGAAVAVAAQTGLLRAIYPPLIGPIVGAGIALPVVWYFRSAELRAFIETIGLAKLTAFHIWRIPAALLFFWYGSRGLLPPTFVNNAGWGDLMAGLLALWATFSRPSRAKYTFVHLFGFTDFVVAVGTGLAFTLLHDPRMAPVRALPMALIPLYGVGISGATHIMAFDLLRKGRGTTRAE